ncbi:MAG: hypothetical protein H7Y11_12635 [Armatimonadetes bacterium]|nr:hypothetical protein [Anaerolineae bacterium]
MLKTLALCVLLLIAAIPVWAQDDAETTDTNTPPSIIALTPAEVTIPVNGIAVITVTYEDPDGDATRFEWTMLSTDMRAYQLPAGSFNQLIVGEIIPVAFSCSPTASSSEIGLEVVDFAGNRSPSATFTLICEGATPPAPTIPQPIPAENSTPTIVSVTPEELTFEGAGTLVLTIEVENADGDPVRLLWNTITTNARFWSVPDGNFGAGLTSASIPVTFFCSAPTFKAVLQLRAEDLAGNLSKSVIIPIDCAR